MEHAFAFTHQFDDQRCWDCHRWWFKERHQDASCPYCAHDSRAKRNEENARLERSVAALRGAITKLKRSRRR